MSAGFHFADPVQPDRARALRLCQALQESLEERVAAAAIADASLKLQRAFEREARRSEVPNAARLLAALALIADYALGLRGAIDEEMARRDLAEAVAGVALAALYKGLSAADGVPHDVVRRELRAMGWVA